MSTPQSPPSGTPRTLPEYASIIFHELRHLIGGKYRLEERLDEGAVGVVHRAVHLGLEKSFAIKLLKTAGTPASSSLRRFQREAVALGRLQHPHIVEVTDSGIDEASGVPYLVMELLKGVPLSEICRRQGPLPLARALPILEQIASAVDAAHSAGVLHRDLKPGNILVCEAGPDAPQIKVLDFGLADLLAGPDETGLSPAPGGEESPPGLSMTGALRGTPLYVAPEVIRRGEVSRAADLYSFGVLAYELLGGKPPFQGTMSQVLEGHLEEQPPPLPLPREGWSALREALEKEPANRPRTALEIVHRLRVAAGYGERARWRRTEVPRRILIATLLAAVLPSLGLFLPSSAIERWAYDLRVRSAPTRLPDSRILLVTLDDSSLAESFPPLADRAHEISYFLDRIFAAGARGVAVDILLPDQWSTSPAFSALVLRHPASLTLASYSAPDGSVLGTGCISGPTAAALGPQWLDALFSSVNLEEDPDGVVRRGHLTFHDQKRGQRFSWAARAAAMIAPLPASSTAEGFWIDHRVNESGFDRISWRDVPTALARRPALFQDRLVLVVGNVEAAGDDVHRAPRPPDRAATVYGHVLQALLVDTTLAGLPVRDTPRAPFLRVAALWTGLVAAAALLIRRLIRALAVFAGGLVFYLSLSIQVFQKTALLLPVTLPLLPALVALVLALSVRRFLPPIPLPLPSGHGAGPHSPEAFSSLSLRALHSVAGGNGSDRGADSPAGGGLTDTSASA